ncbi:MAG: tetratricopeptide repeat protein [Deltaproteobacteria bacterium]|nr:tetratricopeptide repeat protein [Deltaproteobacteria bacterium]
MIRLTLVLLLICAPALADELEEARGLVEAGSFEEARGILVGAIEVPSQRAQGLVLLTEALNGLEEYEEGVKTGEEAVKLLPESSEAHFQYAVALRIKMSNVGKMKAMFTVSTYKKELQRAIDLDPENVDALTEEVGYLGNAPGIAGGDLDKAREKAQELRKYDKRAAAQMLAQIEMKDGHPDKAIQALEELVEATPDDWPSRFQLAMMLQGEERYQDADLQFAAVVDGDDRRLSLGALYQRARTRVLGKYDQEKAVELLQEYAELPAADLTGLPSASSAHWRMGNAYEQLSRKPDARAAYQTALRLDPKNKDAKKALKSLGR